MGLGALCLPEELGGLGIDNVTMLPLPKNWPAGIWALPRR